MMVMPIENVRVTFDVGVLSRMPTRARCWIATHGSTRHEAKSRQIPMEVAPVLQRKFSPVLSACICGLDGFLGVLFSC